LDRREGTLEDRESKMMKIIKALTQNHSLEPVKKIYFNLINKEINTTSTQVNFA
jgi:hypothetical protein